MFFVGGPGALRQVSTDMTLALAAYPGSSLSHDEIGASGGVVTVLRTIFRYVDCATGSARDR